MSKKTDDSRDQGFIRRWSRKKSESVSPDETGNDLDITPGDDVVPLPQLPVGEAIAADNLNEEDAGKPALCDDDMPPIESLTEDGDYSGFMSPGVSQKLRQAAMRKLFASAGFNIRDGLDDYDEDFRNFAPLGDIVTCDMKHQIEMAEKRKREAEEELAQNAIHSGEEAEAVEADEHTADEAPADNDRVAEEIDETGENDPARLANGQDDEDEPVKS